jgi:hypothetical protein
MQDGWMITDQQVRRLMKLTQSEATLAQAAAKAGMDEKTARKYLQVKELPSQMGKVHVWRTRPDPFEEVWGEIEEILRPHPTVQAKTMFEHLCRKYPGRFQEGQLRSLQRRFKQWRARLGPEREVMFPQTYDPGRQCQSDFTHMSSLMVTIGGQKFDHMAYHFVLAYSNWETVTLCFSESFESLSAGLQNALWQLGGTPEEHRTDSLTAAVNNLKDPDEFTDRYQGLLDHYGLSATHTQAGKGHENGDVEQSHHRFKMATDQELMLRGSRDFENRDAYVQFLTVLIDRRNAARSQRLGEEVGVLRRLPLRRLDHTHRIRARVSRHSTISVRRNAYSVDSRLIGEQVEVHLDTERMEVWYGGKCVEQMPRLRGSGKHAVDYRHVIHSLVRKPGAFPHYRYQQDMFPRLLFRVAYDWLREHHPGTADRQYLKILEMAAMESEDRVHEVLRHRIDIGLPITDDAVREHIDAQAPVSSPFQVRIDPPQIRHYDALLAPVEEASWL